MPSTDKPPTWVNRFRKLDGDHAIVHEFSCRCDPKGSTHQRMMLGALRNMREDCYLEDGIDAAAGLT
jgi:hypothetical protein